MNLKILIISIFLLSILSGNAQFDNQEALLKSFHSISSNELLDFAKELTSEQYKGRLSGSPEYIEVAKWCANQLESWGVKPANNGSFFQYFPNEYSEVNSLGKVTYSNGEQTTELKFPDDYLPGSNSDSGTLTGNLVYVGYGITAPELGYDDYAKVDVKGKIIILESGIPYAKNDTTLAKWTPYAYHRYKFRNAVKHVAAGMVYTNTIANPNTVHLNGFIYSHISSDVAGKIMTDAGKDYEAIKKDLQEMKIPSFALPQQ